MTAGWDGSTQVPRIPTPSKRPLLQTDGSLTADQPLPEFRGLEHTAARKVAAKAKGMATAEVIQATGLSEAEAMRKKALSFAMYNEAAVAQMLVDVLPRVAEAVAAPLAKTERIVIIGGGGDGKGAGASKITRDITDIVAQLPPVLESLTGIQLRDLIDRVPGLGEKIQQATAAPEPPPPPAKPK